METLADRRRTFREKMDRREAMIIPGAGNALTARVIADQQFDAVYVTGAGIANTYLGAPDIGLVTLTELAGAVSAISEICHLPLVVDIDTGRLLAVVIATDMNTTADAINNHVVIYVHIARYLVAIVANT